MTESPLPFQFGADPESFRVTPAAGIGTGDDYHSGVPDQDRASFTAAATGEQPNVNETPRDERGDSARFYDGRFRYP